MQARLDEEGSIKLELTKEIRIKNSEVDQLRMKFQRKSKGRIIELEGERIDNDL
jgi:hypothetical protein